jgi:Flp pilus assembly secretin CpaC
MTAKLGARAFAFALAFLLTTISVTWAADQTITLELGAGSAVVLERPFKTVLIGDPNVVDVQKPEWTLGYSQAAESRSHKPRFH